MKNDLRIVHWDEIAGRDWLTDLRLRCYERLLRAPATPDELAAEFRLSVLAVRPRCSELRKGLPRHARNPLVLARATGDRRGGAHVLAAIPFDDALQSWRTAGRTVVRSDSETVPPSDRSPVSGLQPPAPSQLELIPA